MSAGSSAPLRTVTFGDLEAGVWGAVWGGAHPFLALGLLDGTELDAADGSLQGSGAHEQWRVVSERAELTIAPEGDAVPAPREQGFDQLCRVRGQLRHDRDGIAVDCLGRRACRVRFPDFERFASLRDVSAWFAPDDGISLLSLRPRRASGHADDLITAAVFEPEANAAVTDPRLSTSYAAGGLPFRLSLELWLDDDQGEEASRYPRRAAGEAIGARLRFARGELDIDAELLRCHSHGCEGAGVYLLVRAS